MGHFMIPELPCSLCRLFADILRSERGALHLTEPLQIELSMSDIVSWSYTVEYITLRFHISSDGHDLERYHLLVLFHSK